MDERRCDWCGGSMTLVRADARYCSTKCRVYANRAAKRGVRVPKAMVSRDRWVRFMSTKRPVTVAGKSASSTDAATWASFEDASAATVGEGVGFVLGDGIGCIDLDHCFEDGQLAGWARDVLEANPGTFVEVSRSGEGLHVFGLLPEGPGRKVRDGRSIEVYSSGRYIALTGRRFENAPLRLEPLTVPSL